MENVEISVILPGNWGALRLFNLLQKMGIKKKVVGRGMGLTAWSVGVQIPIWELTNFYSAKFREILLVVQFLLSQLGWMDLTKRAAWGRGFLLCSLCFSKPKGQRFEDQIFGLPSSWVEMGFGKISSVTFSVGFNLASKT